MLQNDIDGETAFPRDVCALCSNIFFAHDGRPGLEIDKDLVGILQRAQQKSIDSYAIFKKDGSADGKKGSYLPLDDDHAAAVIEWIRQHAQL